MGRGIEAVVWDLDGTLVDSGVVVPDALAAAVEIIGGTPCSQSAAVGAYALGSVLVVLSHLLGRPATAEDVDVYHSQLGRSVSTVRAYPEIEETLESLAGRYPMGVFTGAGRVAAEMLLDHSGLGRFFYHVITADQTEHPKPHPEGLLRLSASMDVAVDRIVLIGDSPLDVEAARSAGAHVVSAAWGHLYRPGVDADLVCMRPSEILPWIEATVAAAQ